MFFGNVSAIMKHLFKTNKTSNKKKLKSTFEEPHLALSVAGYVSYVFLFVVGKVREFIWGQGPLNHGGANKANADPEGYAPLYASFESFYTRNVYRRLKDVFNRPIRSVPGAKVRLAQRKSHDNFWTWKMTPAEEEEQELNCINLASYNYLGYAESSGPRTEAAIKAVAERGLAPCSPRLETGTLSAHKRLESDLSAFLGVDDAMVVGMGFATNALSLPALVRKGCLVLSDEKNHASLILGLRLSGATVMVFKHNNVDNLEKILRKAVIQGHPRTRRPWKKILIVVEGVYSMEGTIVKLPEILAIKNKYGAYLYLDEAHSIGAMGPNGRGVVDHFGLNPKDIDIMMGTFTKSFGASGGYIAGSKPLIDFLRRQSHASAYPASMSAPVVAQIDAALRSLSDPEGQSRVKRLARNASYFRRRLQQMGCIVYGDDASPVVPVMLYMPAKISAAVNGLWSRGVAGIAVGFPATNMAEERIRFCISASHTEAMLDEALEAIDAVATEYNFKHSRRFEYADTKIVY